MSDFNLRIIDFLEIYKDLENKDKIVIHVFISKTREDMTCTLENFRKKMCGKEYLNLRRVDIMESTNELYFMV